MTERSKPRSFRFSPATLEAIQAEAAAQGVSVNAWVEAAAESALRLNVRGDGGGESHVTAEKNVAVEAVESPSANGGLSAVQLAQVLAAEADPSAPDPATSAALAEAYARAAAVPSSEPVREVPANPLPDEVTSRWLPDDPDTYEPGQATPGSDDGPTAYANDPLGMLRAPGDEPPPEVDNEPDPHSVRPAGARWVGGGDNCGHRNKVTQNHARRVVCGDCTKVLSTW